MSDSLATRVSVLIVIDLQVGMFDGVRFPPIEGADQLIERAREVIGWARRSGHKVAFIRHDGPEGSALAPGGPGWPLWPALDPADNEPVFAKCEGDAFGEPALGDWVRDLAPHEVILIGAQTDGCVAATLKGALARGLEVVVISDAHSTWPTDDEAAQAIIARHNGAFAAAGARVISAADLTGL